MVVSSQSHPNPLLLYSYLAVFVVRIAGSEGRGALVSYKYAESDLSADVTLRMGVGSSLGGYNVR